MRIGITGQGRVGSALHAGWARAGHDVQMGRRSSTHGTAESATWAEVLVLAVPHAALDDVAVTTDAAAKIVIDCINPVAMGPDGIGLALGHATSDAERLKPMPPGARVVKTLNLVGAEVVADAQGFGHPPFQRLAGADEAAKPAIAGLLSDLGFEPFDAGGLSKARLLEPVALVSINQANARKSGREWAFGALPRQASA